MNTTEGRLLYKFGNLPPYELDQRGLRGVVGCDIIIEGGLPGVTVCDRGRGRVRFAEKQCDIIIEWLLKKWTL